MLGKAARTKDLTSYSSSNLVLANVGNAVYSVYVFHLPPGPIWLLHSFYVVSSALMLLWSLRYPARARAITGSTPEVTSHTIATGAIMHTDHDRDRHRRRRPGRPRHRVPPPARGTPLRHPRRRGPRRRRLATAVGQPPALHPGPGRRAAGHALPRRRGGRSRPRTSSPTTWSRMPPQLGLPVRLRDPRRRAHGACGAPVAAPATSSPRTADRSAPTTSSSPRAPSAGRRTCPDFADQLDPSILQLHSSEYRRPAQLPRRPGPRRRRLPLRLRHRLRGRRDPPDDRLPAATPDRSPSRSTRRCSRWSSRPMLVRLPARADAPDTLGRRRRTSSASDGGPRLRVQRRDLAARGVDWVTDRVDRRQ